MFSREPHRMGCARQEGPECSEFEDWIGVDKPVNVPGTYTEYPNWRRKLTADLEDIFANQHVIDMTKSMTLARE